MHGRWFFPFSFRARNMSPMSSILLPQISGDMRAQSSSSYVPTTDLKYLSSL